MVDWWIGRVGIGMSEGGSTSYYTTPFLLAGECWPEGTKDRERERKRPGSRCAVLSHPTSRHVPVIMVYPPPVPLWVSVWRRSMSIVQMSPFPLEVPLRERERVLLEGPLEVLRGSHPSVLIPNSDYSFLLSYLSILLSCFFYSPIYLSIYVLLVISI